MNKKLLLSIMMLLCAHTLVYPAQTVFMTPNAEPLTVEENEKYQALLAEFKKTRFIAMYRPGAIDLFEAQRIVEKRANFLNQELVQPSTMWPYWLGASLLPVARGLSMVGRTMGNVGLPLPGTIYYARGQSTPLDLPLQMINQATSVLDYMPIGIASVGNLLIYHVLPLMAFYGIYKKYSTREQQLQELNTLKELYGILKLIQYGPPSP